MELSVILVNYNVKYFLEQCLASVEKAVLGMDAEVFVVDNASADGSVEYLTARFPTVQFIANTDNAGFAKACNQAYLQASGQFILFLNPDTIVPEDCFSKCLQFFHQTADCGALGVRMTDGSGNFLKESKRGFPTPLVSFYKLSGLSRLFPHSRIFARYHLGHLSEHENHEVDVLAGAFMMIRKDVLQKTGAFDESFFMYGEDIDLSYRIQKAEYKNYYFAETTILHFKGESTRKGSLNYVKMFYTAMSLFVKKHYGQWRAGVFRTAIQSAIWLRAAVSAGAGFIRKAGLPLIDAGLVLLCIWGVKLYWFANIRPEVRYVREVLIGAASLYTVIYISVGYFTGLYDKPFKQSNLNRCAIVAGILLLAVYGLLPEHYRFSRGIILISAILVYFSISLLRLLLIKSNILESAGEVDGEKQTVVVASPVEYAFAQQFFTSAGMSDKLLGRIDPGNDLSHAIGNADSLHQLQKKVSFREVVFCAGEMSYGAIIEKIQQLPKTVKVTLFGAGTGSMVGSESKDTSGQSFTAAGKFRLNDPAARRCKRLADAGSAIVFLVFCPILIWFIKNKMEWMTNLFSIFSGKKTWVGYSVPNNQLPLLRKSVLATNGLPHIANSNLSEETLTQLDYRYAKNYRCRDDVRMIFYQFLSRVDNLSGN